MTPLFPSPLEAIIFWAILVIVVSAVLVTSLRQRRSGEMMPRRRQNASSARSIAVGIGLVIAVGIAIGYSRLGALPGWVFYPGEVLFAVGAALTGWSYAILGRHVSPHVEVLPDHWVIKSGPYRYIRHPGYLGQIVTLLGFGLAVQSWLAELTTLVIVVGLFGYRIRIEEEFLISELGGSYVDYMKGTKRIIPFIC
jgi:protein-S-isoprenylcysteine O-methyltransferase Ste14